MTVIYKACKLFILLNKNINHINLNLKKYIKIGND